MNANYAYTLMVAHRYDEARQQFSKCIERDPDFRVAHATARNHRDAAGSPWKLRAGSLSSAPLSPGRPGGRGQHQR